MLVSLTVFIEDKEISTNQRKDEISQDTLVRAPHLFRLAQGLIHLQRLGRGWEGDDWRRGSRVGRGGKGHTRDGAGGVIKEFLIF